MTSALQGMQEQFIQQGLQQGLQQGRQQGLQQGRRESDAGYARIIPLLLREKRYDDLQRITEDREFREQILREFKII